MDVVTVVDGIMWMVVEVVTRVDVVVAVWVLVVVAATDVLVTVDVEKRMEVEVVTRVDVVVDRTTLVEVVVDGII